MAVREKPGREQCEKHASRRKRAAQIVEHFPAAEHRDVERAAPPTENPREKLPIAARPSLLAGRGCFVVRRILIYEFDVGDECGARENSLEEIMAEQNIVGNFAFE